MVELSTDVKVGSEWVEKATGRRLVVQAFEFWKPEVPAPAELMSSCFGVVSLFDERGVIHARVPEDVGRFVPMPERDQRWERRGLAGDVVVPRFVADGRVEYVDESTGARGSKTIGDFISEFVCISTREMTHARLGRRSALEMGSDADGTPGARAVRAREVLPAIEIGAVWVSKATGQRHVVNEIEGDGTSCCVGLCPEDDDPLTIDAALRHHFAPMPKRGQRWEDGDEPGRFVDIKQVSELVMYAVAGGPSCVTMPLAAFVRRFRCVADGRPLAIVVRQVDEAPIAKARPHNEAALSRLVERAEGVLTERWEAWKSAVGARPSAAASGLHVDVGAVWVDRKTGERWTVESYAPARGVCGFVLLRRGDATTTVDMRHAGELYAPTRECVRCGSGLAGGKHCTECARLERALAELRRVEWRVEVPLHEHNCSECRIMLPKNQAAIFRVETTKPGGGGAFKVQCWPCAAKAKVEHERVKADVKWALRRRAEMHPDGSERPTWEGLPIPTIGRIGARS